MTSPNSDAKRNIIASPLRIIPQILNSYIATCMLDAEN